MFSKDAFTLCKLLEGFESTCEKQKSSSSVVSPAFIMKFHSYLVDYSKILKDERLLDYKMPVNARVSSNGTEYYWVSEFEAMLSQAIIHLKARYKFDYSVEIEMIKDEQLKIKCYSLFNSEYNKDTIIMQATTVLEDRLRNLANLKRNKDNKGLKLIDKTLNPQSGLLRASNIMNEREGIFQICRGLYLAYRNETHHAILDDINMENAFKITMMIDQVLIILNKTKNHESTTSITEKSNPN